MEWLWVVGVIAVLFGPIAWVLIKDRTGGAPSTDDVNAGSTVADSIRQIASGDRVTRLMVPPEESVG